MTLHHSPDDKLAETCAAVVKAEFALASAALAYDAAKAEWQRELYLALGKPGVALNYWDALAKGKPGSLLREKHTAFIAARKAYDDAGEEVADDMPDDERCGECDGLRGSCSWCQGEAIGDARRGEDYP